MQILSVSPIIAKKLEATRCPSSGKWKNKLYYIHAVEYYLANRKNEEKRYLCMREEH